MLLFHYKRWELPESVRDLVIKHCLHDTAINYWLWDCCLPDHVHIVISPLKDSNGEIYGLSEIMSGIKGASAHSINKFLQRKGHVWQAESFDHILRSDEKIVSKVDYICEILFERTWLRPRMTIRGCGGSGWKGKRPQPRAAVLPKIMEKAEKPEAGIGRDVAQPPPAVCLEQ